ncbi:MAG: VapC toxin family PIN domain ribonuclease [Verrucomicrobia bacterium]|nr:VapC toxin family PIN domain ribonuclease [Verrucomicrobiota bacterium]
MSWLLDGNVIVALLIDTHPHYQRATTWFSTLIDPVVTCAMTEGTYLRLHMQMAADRSARAAWQSLADFQANPRHRFVDDGFSYEHVANKGIQGHKQVTDAWLTQLASRQGIRLATLDAGLVAAHPDVGFLIPELASAAQL